MATPLNTAEINCITRFIREKTGMMLGEDKLYLIDTRMRGLLNKYKCGSFLQLCKMARDDKQNVLTNEIIDAITIKETMFFRDGSPFDLLREKIFHDIAVSADANYHPKPIRVWSAACSTGQEAYSIVMTAIEVLPDILLPVLEVVGTDISVESINRARQGYYNNAEITRGMDKKYMHYFVSENGNGYTISDKIKSKVSFKVHNLLDSFASLGTFDIIFCRNVSIYMDLEERKRLFEKIANALKRDGYLILGSSESLVNISDTFKVRRYGKSIYYQLA